MTVVSRMIQARGGDLVVDIRKHIVEKVEDAAREFGLFSSRDIYHEISAREAEAVLGAVLLEDMAHSHELMPLALASQLAADFIGAFSDEPATFYTNGEYGKPRERTGIGPAWSPATNATFDTGVLVLSKSRIGCAWFMDED